MMSYEQAGELFALLVFAEILVMLRLIVRSIDAGIRRFLGEKPAKLFNKTIRWGVGTSLVCFLLMCALAFLRSASNAAATREKLTLAVQCGQRGDFTSMIRLATEVIDRQPSNAAALTMRGGAYGRAGQMGLAIADLDRAVEFAPRMSGAYAMRASIRRDSDLHRYSREIIADLNRAIELDPKSSAAYLLRANQFADLGDEKTAIADYDRALDLSSSSYDSSYNALTGRAGALMYLGRMDEAQRDLEAALALDPPAKDRAEIEQLLQSVASQRQ